MTDPQEPLSDEQLEEILAPLRAVKLPDQAHAVNMAAVRRALSHRTRSVWWQRTVAVPVPVAIATVIALAFTTTAILRPLREPLKIAGDGAPPTQAEDVAAGTISNFGANAPNSAWSVSRSYIDTIESITNTHAFLMIDAKEKRDAF